MKKKLNPSLKTKLISHNFFITTLISILLGGFSYLVTTNIIVENTKFQTQQVLSQTSKSIEYSISEIKKISDMLFSNSILNGIISKDNKPTLNDEREVQAILEHYFVNTPIYNIHIITNSGYIYRYGPKMNLDLQEAKNRSWYERLQALDGRQLLIAAKNNEFRDRNDSMMVTNMRLLKDVKANKVSGILIINSSSKVLRDVFKDIDTGAHSQLFLVDKYDSVIASKDTQYIGLDLKEHSYYKQILEKEGDTFYINIEGDKKLIILKDVPSLECRLINVIPYSSLTKGASRILFVTVTAILIACIIAMIYNVYISKKLINPIIRLKKYMNTVEKGDLAVRIEETPKNEELLSLFESFNAMVTQVEELTQNLDEAHTNKRKSEIKALQAQINPHFLYNTLESVNSLAKIYDVEDISRIVISLSEILRASIGNETEVITIREELIHLKSYINIQQIRYKDKFEVAFDVDESILDCKLIKLILQPLVENSLMHGIYNIEDTGVIDVRIKDLGDKVSILVADNGMGMDRDELNVISDALYNKKKIDKAKGGYGIKNVNDRLYLIYGENSQLRYNSEPYIKTTVQFIIPKIL